MGSRLLYNIQNEAQSKSTLQKGLNMQL